MSIFRINNNKSRQSQIDDLNDMVLEIEGLAKQGKFDKNELDQIFSDFDISRKYTRLTTLGNTVTTYTNWSHVQSEDGYSIWKITPSSYDYNANNQLYFDDYILDNRGEAGSETATTFGYVYMYDGDSGGGYTNNSTEAGTAGGTEFSINNSTNDYLYIGDAVTFTGIKFEWQTRGSNYTIKVEYYNSAWTELTANTNNLSDNTSDFESDGYIKWDLPSDWATTSINSQIAYWIRISTTTTPVTTAKAYYIIPYNSVIALLAMSSSQLQDEDWAWCSYSTAIYVTIPNTGNTSYEGSRYITSASTATNLQNFFVHNHEYKLDYASGSYSSSVVYLLNNINNKVETKTSDYTVQTDDNIILVEVNTASNVRITLPSAHGIKGKTFTIKSTNVLSGGTKAVLDPQSGETIDGSGTYNLTSDNKYVTIISDDDNWWVIANN